MTVKGELDWLINEPVQYQNCVWVIKLKSKLCVFYLWEAYEHKIEFSF